MKNLLDWICNTILKVKFLSKNSILTKPQHFSRVFHPIFFWQFFSWNQSCQQLKSPKPQHFHEFFTPKNRQFSREIKVEFLDKDFEQCATQGHTLWDDVKRIHEGFKLKCSKCDKKLQNKYLKNKELLYIVHYFRKSRHIAIRIRNAINAISNATYNLQCGPNNKPMEDISGRWHQF